MRRDAFVCVFHRSRRRRMDQRWRIGDRVEARYRAGTTPAVLLPTGEAGWYPGEVVDVRVDVSGAATYDIQYDDGDFDENLLGRYVREPCKPARGALPPPPPPAAAAPRGGVVRKRRKLPASPAAAAMQ